MKRISEELPIKEIIESLFKNNQLEEKYIETKIPTIWQSAVGKFIAERTLKIFVKKHTLYVYLNSAPLKQEMMHNKAKVIQLVNEKLNLNYIKELTIR